jgi:hypothetical protein
MKVRVRLGEEVYAFPVRQFLFLCNVVKASSTDEVEAIGREMGVGLKQVGRWMGEAGVKAFIGEKLRRRVVRAVYGEDDWFSDMVSVWQGETEVSKNRMEAGKELGARLAPKIERVQHEFDDTDFMFVAKKAIADDVKNVVEEEL